MAETLPKVKTEKSKTVWFAFYGSDDNVEMPNEKEFKQMEAKLKEYRPEDVATLPSVLAGAKLLKLRTERVVITERERLSFEPGRSKRARDFATSLFVARASEALGAALETTRPKLVLVPYWVKIARKKVS